MDKTTLINEYLGEVRNITELIRLDMLSGVVGAGIIRKLSELLEIRLTKG
jgi:hypothetical protein